MNEIFKTAGGYDVENGRIEYDWSQDQFKAIQPSGEFKIWLSYQAAKFYLNSEADRKAAQAARKN